MAERSEAKSAKRSFASKYLNFVYFTHSFASRFLLRFAKQFLSRFKLTNELVIFPANVKTSEATHNFKNLIEIQTT